MQSDAYPVSPGKAAFHSPGASDADNMNMNSSSSSSRSRIGGSGSDNHLGGGGGSAADGDGTTRAGGNADDSEFSFSFPSSSSVDGDRLYPEKLVREKRPLSHTAFRQLEKSLTGYYSLPVPSVRVPSINDSSRGVSVAKGSYLIYADVRDHEWHHR